MSLTIEQALRRYEQLAAVSETPDLDLQLLLAHVLARPRVYLFTWPEKVLSDDEASRFDALLARRRQGEPVAHMLGYREFWSLTLEVGPETLIPRPETECLVEQALAVGGDSPCRVLDLGTGSGAIALALATERPAWQLVGVDRVAEAVALAERNRARLGLENVRFQPGDWCRGLAGRFDLILSNPPYIDPDDPHLGRGDVRFEPRSALVAGEAGLADLQAIADQARAYLQPGGWLLLEHGYNQAGAVRACLQALGYEALHTARDLAGQPRVSGGRWPGKGRSTPFITGSTNHDG